MRRSTEPFDGRVARRARGGGAIAEATSPPSRAAAASRLRSCERCSDAVTVSTPWTSRAPSRSTARSWSAGGSSSDPVRSQDSSTRESVVFTP